MTCSLTAFAIQHIACQKAEYPPLQRKRSALTTSEIRLISWWPHCQIHDSENWCSLHRHASPDIYLRFQRSLVMPTPGRRQPVFHPQPEETPTASNVFMLSGWSLRTGLFSLRHRRHVSVPFLSAPAGPLKWNLLPQTLLQWPPWNDRPFRFSKHRNGTPTRE